MLQGVLVLSRGYPRLVGVVVDGVAETKLSDLTFK